MDNREYAIVVFGASGFTGQFVVREVARASKGKFKWAVAGRKREKLEKVLRETAQEIGRDLSNEADITIADVSDEASLNHMCLSAKIVLNCVGPYRFFGEPVVKAAILNGCHHLDISGEPEFLESMQLKYHEQAVASDVLVVGTCGFDSIPADVGVLFTQEQFPGTLCHVESYMSTHSGSKGFRGHYGTYQSIIHGVASHSQGKLKTLRKQLFPKPLPKYGPKLDRRGVIFYSNEVQKWCMPFLGSDASVVRRTQRHNVEARDRKPVQYGAYMAMPSLLTILMLYIVGFFFVLLCQFKKGRQLLENHPKVFSLGFFSHEGPTREQMEQCSFSFVFHGSGYSKKALESETLPTEPDGQIVTKVTGPEPGYVATPIFMVQAAMVILEEGGQALPHRGGVLTPAAAFAGTSLIEKLSNNGIQFKVQSTNIAK